MLCFQVANSRSSLQTFVQRTLFFVQSRDSGNEIMTSLSRALDALLERRLVTEPGASENEMSHENTEERTLAVTDLGRAVFKGGKERYSVFD